MRVAIYRSMMILAGGVAMAALLPIHAAIASEASEIAAVRDATAKYMDVEVALADGYVPAPSGCVTAAKEGLPPEWGGMGIHYVHPGMLKLAGGKPPVNGKSTHTDFLKPAILLYEPQADESLELVGVENLVFQVAWKEAGNSEPPVFAGQTWNTMADDPATPDHEAHNFEPHYDLHVWTLRENPSGALMPFNPNVNCDNSKEQSDH